MQITSEITTSVNVDIPVGIFIKDKLDKMYFVANENLLVRLDHNRIVLSKQFYGSERKNEFVQITKAEFKKQWWKTLRSFDTISPMLDAAADFIDQDVFTRPNPNQPIG